jgi:hypothetical protein
VPNSTNFTLNVKYNPGRLVPALGRCPAATRQGPLGQRQGHENRASQASHGVVPITLSSQCHTRTEMEVFAEKPRPTLERPPIAVRVRHPGEGQRRAPSGGGGAPAGALEMQPGDGVCGPKESCVAREDAMRCSVTRKQPGSTLAGCAPHPVHGAGHAWWSGW